ncbi:MAG: alginate export family protein [Leptospiraceae bacterium]|nr:alginate export family protein [Leptospiraceae bacterium]
MNSYKLILIFIIFSGFSVLAQNTNGDGQSKKTKDKSRAKISEIEANLQRQQKELNDLKALYGVKADNSSKKDEEHYVSPLKTDGLKPDYNRSMFLDPNQAKAFNNNKKPWLNDWIRLGAYVRARNEERFNLGFDKQSKGNTSRILQTSQLFFIIDPSPYFSMKINVQDARVWGGSTPASSGDFRANAFAAVGNTTTPGQTTNIPSQTAIREAWFMLKSLPLGAKLQVGRQILVYGDQRMIGGANWTINGLSYDGARLMFDKDNYNIHFLGYKLLANQSGTNGVLSASAPSSYTDPVTGKSTVLNQGNPNQYMTGTYNTVKVKDWMALDLYSLGILTAKTQSFSGATLTNPSLTIPSSSDLDLYANQWSKQQNNLITTGFRLTNRTAGNKLSPDSPWKGWDWTIENAWQTGTTGERVNKNSTLNAIANEQFDQAAGISTTTSYNFLAQNQKYTGRFHVFQTGYTFWEKMRLGVQVLYASGDSHRGNGSSSTFQTLLMPRFGGIPYWNNVAGLSENIGDKNLISKTANVSYKTDKFGTFFASYFVNNKVKTQDSWYAISGAANSNSTVEHTDSQTTFTLANSNRKIYNEIDLTWMYNINDYVSLWIGGGLLNAGKSVKNQKNAIASYNISTNTLNFNNAVILGQSGAASKAHMFFFQLNAAF